jgi:hypothetical protein
MSAGVGQWPLRVLRPRAIPRRRAARSGVLANRTSATMIRALEAHCQDLTHALQKKTCRIAMTLTTPPLRPLWRQVTRWTLAFPFRDDRGHRTVRHLPAQLDSRVVRRTMDRSRLIHGLHSRSAHAGHARAHRTDCLPGATHTSDVNSHIAINGRVSKNGMQTAICGRHRLNPFTTKYGVTSAGRTALPTRR